MHKIEAIVQRSITDQVRDALTRQGVEGVTMSDLRGAPAPGSSPTFYRGATYVADVLQTKVEGLVADAEVTAVVEAIVATVRAAGCADGRIVVYPVTGIISIATGATSAGAPPRDKRPRLRPIEGGARGGDRPARES